MNQNQIEKIAKEIQGQVKGKVLFDDFSRGRYSTDASLYQIKPLGAVLPKDKNDVLRIMEYSQKQGMMSYSIREYFLGYPIEDQNKLWLSVDDVHGVLYIKYAN